MQALSDQRDMLQHREKLLEAMQGALTALSGSDEKSGADSALGSARRLLERAAEKAGGRLEPALAALQRAAAETEEALALIQSLATELELDPAQLEEVEERFFALKELARKHGVDVDELAALRDTIATRLSEIDSGAERLRDLQHQAGSARDAYLAAGEALSARRAAAVNGRNLLGKPIPDRPWSASGIGRNGCRDSGRRASRALRTTRCGC